MEEDARPLVLALCDETIRELGTMHSLLQLQTRYVAYAMRLAIRLRYAAPIPHSTNVIGKVRSLLFLSLNRPATRAAARRLLLILLLLSGQHRADQPIHEIRRPPAALARLRQLGHARRRPRGEQPRQHRDDVLAHRMHA